MDKEKRQSKRKPLNFKTKISLNGRSYPSVIENLSQRGMHVIAATGNKAVPFVPETMIHVELPPSKGDKSEIKCEVRWVHINKTPIHGFTYRMGMGVESQSFGHLNILETLK